MQKHGTVFIVVKVDITNKHVDIHMQSIPDTINTVSIFDLALRRYNRD
jgi:hypothetical protein